MLYDEVKRELSRAFIGFYFMIDEYFGICVVEYMVVGVVFVVYVFGGFFFDIICD